MAETAIQWLQRKAGAEKKIHKSCLVGGETFEFWMYPLTIAEQKAATSKVGEDTTDVGIELLVRKALDANGQRMFQADAGPILRNEIQKDDVETLLIALLTDKNEVEAPDLDMKSRKGTAKA